MRKAWPYIGFNAALVATSVWNAPLAVRIPLWIIGGVLIVRILASLKGFDRWWTLSCTGLFLLIVATLEFSSGLASWARIALACFAVASLVGIIVPQLVALVKVLLEARALIQEVRASLRRGESS